MKTCRIGPRGFTGGLVLGTMWLLTGCAGFFVSTSSTSSTTTGADYVYLVNQSANTLTGYILGTGTLTEISGSPYTLSTGLAAQTVTVSRADTFVYVGGVGGIVCYSIGTSGVLSLVSGSGTSAQNANFVSLDTSPDGNWLFALDSNLNELYVFKINTSTGALAAATPVVTAPVNGGTTVAKMVRISPNGELAAVALSYGGDLIYTFNTTTGALADITTIATGSTTLFDNAVAFDTTSEYLLIGRGGTVAGTSEIVVYGVGNTGVTTSGPLTTTSGNTPYSVLQVKTSTGSYVYSANRGDSTISGFTFNAGTLTALTNGTYGSGSAVDALAADNSGAYIVSVASGGGTDVALYEYDAVTAGRLDAVTVATSGAAGLVAVAATH